MSIFFSFLQESFDVNNEDHHHRSPSHHRAAAAYHQAAAAAVAVAAAANVAGAPMDYNGGPPQPAVAHAANPFDLDSFDMLAAASGTFTELDGGSSYRSPHPEAAAAGFTEPGLLGNAAAAGTSSPMLGSGSAAPAAGPKKERSGGQHFHPPPHITDYSPEWAWTEVS